MTRQYLDQRRTIRLDGRPLYPDWNMLLYLGMRAIEKAPNAPLLDQVMWTGIAPRGRFARPVLFDHPLLRRWLAVEPTRCMDYLRAEWGNLRAPDHPEEALALLARPGCLAAGLGEHRIASQHALHEDGWAVWIVGSCHDCHQAILQCHDEADDFMRSWPFYDHEAVGHRPGARPAKRHSLRVRSLPGVRGRRFWSLLEGERDSSTREGQPR